MSETKLLPCPFCGEKAELIYKDCDCFVKCTICHARTMLLPDEQRALHFWNTRKPMQRIVERLEEKAFWTESTFDSDGYCEDDSEEVVLLSETIEIIKEEGAV